MNKKLFSATLLSIGLLCFGIFSFIGSEVLADGSLHEPFFLLPLGYSFILSSAILFIIDWFETK